ncbi:oxepin-CoA hydrolase/3-oxo-5,6-dehydrosuberyl-CoA semialdehyde dehydrogenase [Agromyces ramosus]|uniref:Oxepin-CoA hydrolase/3-oxo-5,6-dehydrosuberyl-CoA semialdehyde dehydrogenase n=1 Tax=Agromyces ramosus TaxID=33879 RepID=A0ABU0R7B0_9MICO|nr:oxepin-CoA hydrolase/3-oxo-5,6-dehydrosuberyl-CoA semialdehyde dehydrogenase [Agromyces ramosus]
MNEILPSYVNGEWWTPDAAAAASATEVRDASTGDLVARVSTEGLDLGAALEYARTVGQASLGKLTFHQRAVTLKQMALALTERKAELYEISARTGATKQDSWVDVDGGIGVLFTYSSKGRREMPNSMVYIDGAVENLSKDGSFLGRHIYTRLPGVAVQINAFNFPVWGSLEKFAPAFLAGVPTLVKPATPTGYLAEAFVRILDESGLLPEGSLQLVSGSVPDLFDHLRLGDLVAFTGSASTAEKLRQHPSVQTGGVRFTVETDSINASVLGTDAVAGTPEFDAYVKQLVVEMTSKAGQKCTAIRRAIVPEASVDSVVDAVRARIAERVVVGDPRAEGVTMGPLASLTQRDEVLRQVGKLQAAGGELVIGSTDAPGVTLAEGVTGVASDGAFVEPMLLRFTDAASPALHEVEAFGPVASIIGYGSLDEAVALVARGGGSLVTSVATHDPAVAVALAGGIAAYNGRVLFLDRDDARSSTGHGSPLPNLVHGGPGRGRRRRGARRHPRGAAPHAAHRGAGFARDAHGAHGRVARGRGLAARRGASVPQVARRASHRRPDRLGVAHGDPGRHRDVRGVHGRHVLRPHGRGSGIRESVLPGPRRAWLSARVVGRRTLRRCRARAGARELRPREPQVRDAGVAGRLDPRGAHREADHAARDRRVRRGALGRGAAQPERRARGVVRRAHPRGEGARAGR